MREAVGHPNTKAVLDRLSIVEGRFRARRHVRGWDDPSNLEASRIDCNDLHDLPWPTEHTAFYAVIERLATEVVNRPEWAAGVAA